MHPRGRAEGLEPLAAPTSTIDSHHPSVVDSVRRTVGGTSDASRRGAVLRDSRRQPVGCPRCVGMHGAALCASATVAVERAKSVRKATPWVGAARSAGRRTRASGAYATSSSANECAGAPESRAENSSPERHVVVATDGARNPESERRAVAVSRLWSVKVRRSQARSSVEPCGSSRRLVADGPVAGSWARTLRPVLQTSDGRERVWSPRHFRSVPEAQTPRANPRSSRT